MQFIGLGVDIVEVKRVRDARYLERVAEFFFLPEELLQMSKSRDRVQFLASRIAAKEAVIKAYPERLWYHDFAIVKSGEKLQVQFCTQTTQAYGVIVSIAHETAYAVSSAIVTL